MSDNHHPISVGVVTKRLFGKHRTCMWSEQVACPPSSLHQKELRQNVNLQVHHGCARRGLNLLRARANRPGVLQRNIVGNNIQIILRP
jgi:hypothetical protein